MNWGEPVVLPESSDEAAGVVEADLVGDPFHAVAGAEEVFGGEQAAVQSPLDQGHTGFVEESAVQGPRCEPETCCPFGRGEVGGGVLQ